MKRIVWFILMFVFALGIPVQAIAVPGAAEDVLWGTSANKAGSNPSSAFLIDRTSGIASLVGKVVGTIGDDSDTQQGVSGIAVDPTDGTIYAIHGAACKGATLITLNPATGRSLDAGVIITGMGFDGSSTVNCVGGADSLAFDATGNLYVGGFNGGTAGPKLLTVNKTSGSVLSVFALDRSATGLAFDESGNLWASHGGNSPGLISRIDPATGFTLFELVLSESLIVSDLEFDPDDTSILYGSVPDENRLVTIDTTDGMVTTVGPFGTDVSRI